MSKDVVGIVVSGKEVQCTHLARDGDEAELVNQFTWSLQTGEIAAAYAHMAELIRDYVRDHEIEHAVIKASAVGQARPTLNHLKSAELRGVVVAAAKEGGADTQLIAKGTLSRVAGDRNVDEYIEDDEFWNHHVIPVPTKGRREAAFMALMAKLPE